ncbi:MAG: class I SAM-dependent methyltransferase [Anaerolineae bacterium]
MGDSSAAYPQFSKYERIGAYHWAEADPRWSNLSYNVPLVARYRAILDLIPLTSRMILDVGCGDGYLMHLLYRRGFKCLVGIDNDPLGIQFAHEKLRAHDDSAACQVSVASVYNLPSSSLSFDSVVMADVIEHLNAPEQALREVSRVLTPDGALILSTPNWQPDRRWDASHVREYEPEELNSMLAPFFRQVTLYSCWPMWSFRLWAGGAVWRQVLRCLARLGFNPFAISTDRVSLKYGQLIAVCLK